MTIQSEELTTNATISDPQRLAAVRASGLLDSATEEPFDRLTRLAARLTGTPVTFLSVIDENRDFYKSCFGFPEPLKTAREIAGPTFCHYAMVSNGPLVINDTLSDPVYREVPTVKSLGVQAYLGVPLVTATGQVLGSFCAIDYKPRQWTELDIDVMRELAASTLREIELRISVDAERIAQKRLTTLLEQVPAGVLFAEAPSGRVTVANRQVEEILGAPIGDVPDLASYSKWIGFHADGRAIEPLEWPLARALSGEVIRGFEALFQRADGRRIWLRVHGAPVRDADGTIIGSIIAFFDVDEQRRMEIENQSLYREAHRANQAKDDFFAAVTHELRTPMTAIIGWARILKMDALNSPDAIEAADMIESSARVQARLVDDLLDVSRIEAGKIALQREMINLNDVIAEAMKAAEPTAHSQGIRLRSTLAEVPSISADRSRLRQIFGNLLSNSIKFTPTGGLIQISSVASNGVVEIAVRDTGRGIARELLPQIFDRGRQARDAEQGGLGLGLTIVRHLVEMHGGSIRAASEGAGMGSTFTVTLPTGDSDWSR